MFLDGLASIRMCVDPDWLPYDGIEREGEHIGIMSKFHELWSQKIGKAVELMTTDSGQQSLEFIQAQRCDILPSDQEIPCRQHYLATENINICIKRADDGLYVANHLGRNQTVMPPVLVST